MNEPGDDHDQRLQALEARIEDLERRLHDHDHGGPGPKWHDSGSIHPELDDPAIAP